MSSLLTVPKGDTYTTQLVCEDETGTAINLTGATVKFGVKKKANDPDLKALILKNCTLTDPVNGIATLTLTSDDTNRNPGVYAWQLKVIGSGGAVSTCDEGEFVIGDSLINSNT